MLDKEREGVKEKVIWAHMKQSCKLKLLPAWVVLYGLGISTERKVINGCFLWSLFKWAEKRSIYFFTIELNTWEAMRDGKLREKQEQRLAE